MPTECLAKPELPTALANGIGTTINGDHSYWGVEITPAAPEFDSGFPDTIYIPANIQNSPRDLEVTGPGLGSTGSYDGKFGEATANFKFYIIPKNLNYAPVFDHRTGEWTNGTSENKSFSVERIAGFSEITNNPVFDPSQGTDPERVSSTGYVITPKLNCDPYTGLVTGSIWLLASTFNNLINGTAYVPIKLKIENGNGVAEKIVNIMIVDGYFPAQGSAIPQCELPYPGDDPPSCEGKKTYPID